MPLFMKMSIFTFSYVISIMNHKMNLLQLLKPVDKLALIKETCDSLFTFHILTNKRETQ